MTLINTATKAKSQNSKRTLKTILNQLTLLLLFSFTLVSCGGDRYVTDVQVSSTVDNSDLIVSVGADLNLGNISLTDISLPIIVPRTGEDIGLVEIYTDIDGQSKFNVEVNASAIANVQAVVAKLPNGNLLPLIRENNTIVIPVEGGKAHIYLAFSDGVAAVGASIAIRGLDGLGNSVGTTSIFPAFNFGEVRGSAGIYTSKESGKNGFGLFVDISQVIDTNDLVASKQVSLRSAANLQKEEAPMQLDYSSMGTSRRKKRKIDRILYKLHRKSATL